MPQTGVESGDNVGSLTLGATSGSQTLDISGQGVQDGGDQYNQTTLTVSGATTINATGALVSTRPLRLRAGPQTPTPVAATPRSTQAW